MLPIRINRGKYGDTPRWEADPLPGNIPQLKARFEFTLRNGNTQAIKIWGKVDTGADVTIVPPSLLGLSFSGYGGPPRINPESIAGQSNIIQRNITTVGGVTTGYFFRVTAFIGKQRIPSTVNIVTCENAKNVLIGRDILNQYMAVLHPSHKWLWLCNGWGIRVFGLFGKWISG